MWDSQEMWIEEKKIAMVFCCSSREDTGMLDLEGKE